jgi:hypothetical protein
MYGAFFEIQGMDQPSHRNQRWESRENRGRLRHCDGLQTPIATGSFGEPGRREQGPRPGSQDISAVTLVRSRPARGRFSDKEKDEARPLKLFFQRIRRMPSFPLLPELEGFLFSGSALVSQSKSNR